MARLSKAAMVLNDEGIKSPARAKPKAEKQALIVPDHLKTALKKNKPALATFEGFIYSNKKDYVEWITEAKTEITRDKCLAEGKKIICPPAAPRQKA